MRFTDEKKWTNEPNTRDTKFAESCIRLQKHVKIYIEMMLFFTQFYLSLSRSGLAFVLEHAARMINIFTRNSACELCTVHDAHLVAPLSLRWSFFGFCSHSRFRSCSRFHWIRIVQPSSRIALIINRARGPVGKVQIKIKCVRIKSKRGTPLIIQILIE